MGNLGSPSTSNFQIGTAEVRVGPQTLASRLTQGHSIGVVDSASVVADKETVEVSAGFPSAVVAQETISVSTSVSATVREASRRNLKMRLGAGLDAVQPTPVSSLVVTDIALDGKVFSVTASEGSNFSVGDHVTLYPEGNPEKVCFDVIESISTDEITLKTGVVEALAGTSSVINVYVCNSLGFGKTNKTEYFSLSMIQQETSTGRPIHFHFWKASIGGSFSYETNATDFSSDDVEFTILQPTNQETQSGGALEHVASLVGQNPTGLMAVA